MNRELKELEAKCDAQAHIIEMMLGQLISARLIDVDAMIRKIDNFRVSPKSIHVDPIGSAAMSAELDTWAEVLEEHESNTDLPRAE